MGAIYPYRRGVTSSTCWLKIYNNVPCWMTLYNVNKFVQILNELMVYSIVKCTKMGLDILPPRCYNGGVIGDISYGRCADEKWPLWFRVQGR